MLRTRIVILMLVVLTLAGRGLASAQTTTGSVAGSVKDETGSVLPGATVSVANTATGVKRETVSDNSGRYRVTNLNIGEYEVSVTMPGFRPVVRRGIALTIGREAVVEITMSVGAVAEDVTVMGDAPLVNTASGSLGAIVDRETILEIPLNGRDLTGLITLQAGTAMITQANRETSAARKFTVSGARGTDNSILLDGTEVKSWDGGVPAGVSGSFLGGEAIQEFKVERNAYSAEFGGAMGGVINVVSKSGGNEFHGTGYGFTRNDALDAANFRAPAIRDAAGNFVGKEKPDFWRAQYGASAGGRIIRNRTFFFANFEGLRERLHYPEFVTTFSADGRRGVLGNRTVSVNPAVLPYLELWPLPADAVDLGDGTARYSVIQNQPTNEDFYQLRVDHNFSDSDAVFGRVTRQISTKSTPREISRWISDDKVYNTFVTLEHRKIITSRLLNTLRFGFNRRGLRQFTREEPAVDPSLFMVPADKWTFPLGAQPMMGSLNITGVSEVGPLAQAQFVDRRTNRFQLASHVAYSSGAHILKFGVDWAHTRMGGDSASRPGGNVSFDSLEAFLEGHPVQFRGSVLPGTDISRSLRWNTIGSYVQHDWQFHPRATLNLGVRHEFYTVPAERDGKIANLRDPLTDSEITVLGTRGDSWWENPSLRNLAPRVGLAWDPTGSGKTAVRAGVGMFHNNVQPETFTQFLWRTAPFALETNFTAPAGVIPFPVGLYDFIVELGAGEGAMNVFPYDSDGDPRAYPYNTAGSPRMAQWNVNVQRQVLANTAVTVGYAGSRGWDLFNYAQLNVARANLVDGRWVFPAGARRPNAAFRNQNLPALVYSGESWYHALQVELQRRFQAGWQLQVAYTRSDAIDLGSQLLGSAGYGESGGATIYAPDRNLARGPAAHHVGQTISISGVWQLPFGEARRFGGQWPGWADAILGGWQLSGILNLADGPSVPVTIGNRGDLRAIGVGTMGGAERPDLIPGGDANPVIGDPDNYFDASQFTFPPARTIGNLGRNTLVAPGLATVDLGLTKNVTIGSQSRLQFRVEVFNLLNRANLGVPGTLVFNARGSRVGNTGFIGSTATTARQIQLGLRAEW